MQDKASKPVYGVAFHSPLDVDYVKPVGYTATLSPTVEADLFYSEKYFPKHQASVQLVFQSLAELLNQNIRIILDVSTKGQIVPIKSDQIDRVLSIKSVTKAPRPPKPPTSVVVNGVVKKLTPTPIKKDAQKSVAGSKTVKRTTKEKN